MAKTIMVIDDEPDIREYLAAVLEDSGYRTCVADMDGSIVEAVERSRPDLILLDIMMPGRSGVAIYRDLRANPEIDRIPVALISGMEQASSLFQSVSEVLYAEPSIKPPDGFIEKPIRIERLIEVVETLLTT